MHARGRQTDQHIARHDIGARQNFAAFNGTHGKARKIIIATRVHAGHLSRFAADERAASLAAAVSNAGDYALGCWHIQRAGCKVVEEEQWLGTLNDKIVDAHGHEIDANGGVVAGFDGDLELGADAVVGGDQNGVFEAGGLQIEQAAKAAEVGIGARPAGGPHQRLDGFDEAVAGIDVDAGIAVGDGCRR